MDQNSPETIQVIAVDDEIDTKILYEYFFRKEIESKKIGLTFLTNSNDCLQLLAQQNQNTFVLLDINMPGTNGMDILKQIKALYPHVIVIMISAYSAQDTLEKCKRAGAADYIEKPVNFELLRQKILGLVEIKE